MKKTTDLISLILAFGIMIGLLAAPIYFLRWYEVIVIHLICFLTSFIISKVITTRKFKNPQNVFISTLLFGMAGLVVSVFEWKKNTKEKIEEINLKNNDKNEEKEVSNYAELNDRVLKKLLDVWETSTKAEYNKKSFEIWKEYLLNDVLPYDLDEELIESFIQSDNSFNDIHEMFFELNIMSNGFLDEYDSELFEGKQLCLKWCQGKYDSNEEYYETSDENETSQTFFDIPMASNGFIANLPNYYSSGNGGGYGEIGLGSSLNELCEILSKLPIKDYKVLSDKHKKSLFHLEFRHKDDNISLTKPIINERMKSFCTNCGESIYSHENLCGNCGDKIFPREKNEPSIRQKINKKLNDQVFQKLVNVNEHLDEEKYHNESYLIWKAYLISEVFSEQEFIDYECDFFNLDVKQWTFLDKDDKELFIGELCELEFCYYESEELDEDDIDIEHCKFNNVPLINGEFVSNLPDYYEIDLQRDGYSLGKGKTFDDLCKILAMIPITDYKS
jgi:hypothetical protein